MFDTNDEMIRKQQEIIFSKKPHERFAIGADMIDFGYRMVENSIKQTNPNISEIELRIEVFKRYYKNSFSNEEIEKICRGMKDFYTG